MTGINPILFYSNTILTKIIKTGGVHFTARTGSNIIQMVMACSGIASFWVVKSFGRRTLLLFGYAACGICQITIAILTIYEKNLGILVFICLFVACYQITTGQIAWIYAAETCTDISLGVSLYTLWFVVLVLLMTTEPLMNSPLKEQGVFAIFGICCLAATAFTFFFIRETKGLTDYQKKSLYAPKND